MPVYEMTQKRKKEKKMLGMLKKILEACVHALGFVLRERHRKDVEFVKHIRIMVMFDKCFKYGIYIFLFFFLLLLLSIFMEVC